MKFVYLPLLLLLFALTACSGDTKEMEMDQGGTEENGDDAMIGTGNPGNADITLTDMPATEEFPSATIDEVTYRAGTFDYRITGDFELGEQTDDAESVMCANSGKGQHIHLIVDNEPYIAKYEPTFDQPVADGEHHILTFLSRSYHESIKTDAAHRAMKVNVTNGAFGSPVAIEEAMLFYSRPKGTYTGKKETENVMLDFYPVNVELGSEYRVKADINGKEFMIDEWKPYFVKGLPLGDNTITLTLMAGDSAVQTPLNPVRRTFTLQADPTEEESSK